METIIGFLRDLGWGVTAGMAVLLIGGPFVYFQHWGETAKERAERHADNAERAEDARLGPAARAQKKQDSSRQHSSKASGTSKRSAVPS